MSKSNNASTSRAERFLRAWKQINPTPKDNIRLTMAQLEAALKCYELLTVMRDWDPRQKPLDLHEEFDASIIEGLDPPV